MLLKLRAEMAINTAQAAGVEEAIKVQLAGGNKTFARRLGGYTVAFESGHIGGREAQDGGQHLVGVLAESGR